MFRFSIVFNTSTSAITVTDACYAAGANNLERIRRYIAENRDNPGMINAPDDFGQTPLLIAASSGHTDIVRALLAAPGINVNITSPVSRITPLIVAAARGHIDIVRDLLAVPDINLDAQDDRGLTAVQVAELRIQDSDAHREIYVLITRAIEERQTSALRYRF